MAAVARVAGSLLPTLARSWRSIFPSPLLFSVRSDHVLSHSQSKSKSKSKSYLCINTSPFEWYLFDILHPQNPRPVISLPPPPIATIGSSCVSIGHTLFVLGGIRIQSMSDSTDVQIFNTRLNQWSIGPSMNSACSLLTVAAGVVNGKIYTFGSSKRESDSWAEVLDPQLGVWTTVPTPLHIREGGVYPWIAVLGGKLLALSNRCGGLIFDTEAEPTWSDMPKVIHDGLGTGVMGVVDEVLYSLDSRFIRGCGRYRIRGYDPTTGEWKRLEGWDKELLDHKRTWLMNVEGVLCVIWEEELAGYEAKMMIAGIKVSRESGGSLMGTIVWPEYALPPLLPRIKNCVALEL